ncbi:hypothetical protein CH373_09080 [Leptospira perolatii]|uniref:Lipoprotein n=1 Tax=Leptospira perolatii TaxID=2023191 RepID=A0A2M9ZNR8_9LEPT|nr:hypothetical protein [Leptospira perolatii]PJZ69644.1 hypothetical protein CH360_10225 [Leptospira perolatii]PJZ73631.1 hypothetical protein CH373_09080 [Leptospira perolatii]
MKFFLSVRLFASAALLVLLSSCTPLKQEITDQDLKLVLSTMSESRFEVRLNSYSEKPIPDDLALFRAVCEKYRFDSEQALKKLSQTHPKVYSRMVGRDEK